MAKPVVVGTRHVRPRPWSRRKTFDYYMDVLRSSAFVYPYTEADDDRPVVRILWRVRSLNDIEGSFDVHFEGRARVIVTVKQPQSRQQRRRRRIL